MKKLFLFLLPLLSLVFSSCEEEKEAPLLFDVIENTSPEMTYIGYYSPFAYGGEKWYHVMTDFSENDVKLKCTNCNILGIRCEFTKPQVKDHAEISVEATPEETGMDVSLSDDNVITIHFSELDKETSCYSYYGKIYVRGKIGGEDKETIIKLARSHSR